MGASGSGKTTLLNVISAIDTVSAGHIYLEGTDVTGIRPKDLARFRRENLGFVFQDYNLLDALTVSENIALALAINHVPEDSISGRVAEIAETLQISDILEKYPYQVSGDRNSAAPVHGLSSAAPSSSWPMSPQGRLTAMPHRYCLRPCRTSTGGMGQRSSW